MPPAHSAHRLFEARTLFLAALLYLVLALIPPTPFEKPLYLLRLATMPASEAVAVPVAGVASRDLRGSWGAARSGARRHEGIDIFAARGTRVIASTEGVVWRIGENVLGGLTVWVLGPGRLMHYYAHLDRYANIRTGDRIGIGDTLGFVGTTGNAKGGPPHLHYGIYAGTEGAIDPYPLLVARQPGGKVPVRNAEANSGRPRPSASNAIGSGS